jgi:hypothetical protein
MIQVMILMKAKSSQARKKPAARRQTGKVHMPATATGLTSQAGLIPVIKFLQRIGFDKTLNQTVPHQRDDNADYQLVDGAFLALVGMIGGAGYIAKLCVVWSDSAIPKSQDQGLQSSIYSSTDRQVSISLLPLTLTTYRSAIGRLKSFVVGICSN